MSAEVVIYVTYSGDADTRFDRDYYTGKHLPLVLDAWRRYGLLSAAAFFPAMAVPGTIAICECRFRDEAAVSAAFSSPESPAVMADVPRFTSAFPARARTNSL